jgi:aspartate/methionine/tyrosine aminotransferase
MKIQDGAWEFDFEAFEQCITNKTKAVLITNPHSPTGKVWTKEELDTLTVILDKYPSVTVISDDVNYSTPYDGLTYRAFANNCPENFKKTITVYSGSKLFNATGWKIGWAIGPENLISNSALAHEASTFNANVPC